MSLDVTTGELDEVLVASMMEHLEVPLRTLVALHSLVLDSLGEDTHSIEVASAAVEDAIVELVTGDLAIVGVSFELAGVEFPPDEESPQSTAWASGILNALLVRTKLRFAMLSLDYALNVGPIPNLKGTTP